MFRGLRFSFLAVPFTLRPYSHNVFQIRHLGENIKLQRNQLTRRLSRTANLWRFWFNWLVCLRWLYWVWWCLQPLSLALAGKLKEQFYCGFVVLALHLTVQGFQLSRQWHFQ